MTRRHRGGITLIEVLVAIFIMGIGLLAILTLFPLGAMNMARAVRDDRSAQAKEAMAGLIRAYWKAEIVEKNGAGDPNLFNALDNPGVPPAPLTAPPPAGLDEWSYPVVIDPFGSLARPSTINPASSAFWIGDTPTLVPRRTMALFGNNPQYVLAALSLKDTVGYDEDLHLTSDREYRYNVSAVIQRPINRYRFAAKMTVIVYDNRRLFYAPLGSEGVFAATFTPGSPTVVVASAPANLNLKPGGWVMDASVNPGGNATPRPLIRHAFLYQVVSISPDPNNANQTFLELQTPVTTPTDNNAAPYNGTLVVLEGVAGVYTVPQLTGD